MKEHILPRILLPPNLTAFVATLALWCVKIISAAIVMFGFGAAHGHMRRPGISVLRDNRRE